ncbi:MAG: hypothetical protein ABFS23_00710 [Pseudomonadota bacterium]
MAETITATYDTKDKAKNAVDDLIATGIDREKVFLDEDALQVKVMVPNAIEGEITEILQRHQPSQLSKNPVT